MNPVTVEQVAWAERAERMVVRRLGPRGLSRVPDAFRATGPGVRMLILDRDQFRHGFGGSPEQRRVEGERIAKSLARLAVRIIARWRPGTLMLSGGLTAAAVCEALRVRSLTLSGTAPRGLVRSHAVWPGGSAWLLTKPGGFGEVGALRGLALRPHRAKRAESQANA